MIRNHLSRLIICLCIIASLLFVNACDDEVELECTLPDWFTYVDTIDLGVISGEDYITPTNDIFYEEYLSAPVRWNDCIVIRSQEQFFFIDTTTAQLLSNDIALTPDNVSNFRVYDDYLYFIAGNNIFCYELRKVSNNVEANLIWKYTKADYDNNIFTVPLNITANENYIVFYPFFNSYTHIICFNRITGSIVWDKPFETISEDQLNYMVFYDNYLIMASNSGLNYINTSDGSSVITCSKISELFFIYNDKVISYSPSLILFEEISSCQTNYESIATSSYRYSIKPIIIDEIIFDIGEYSLNNEQLSYNLFFSSISELQTGWYYHNSFIPDISGAVYKAPFSLLKCKDKFFIYKRMKQYNQRYPDALSILNGTTGEKYGLCQGQMLGGEAIIVNGKYYSVYYDGSHGYVTIYNIEDSDCSMDNLAYTDVFYDE